MKWGQAAATYANVTNPQFAAQAHRHRVGSRLRSHGRRGRARRLLGSRSHHHRDHHGHGVRLGASGRSPTRWSPRRPARRSSRWSTIVILAIIIAVMEAIRVTENALLPGKVAELVVNARTTVTDPATLIGTTDGAVTLYNLFVGATMPGPRTDLACDNSLIPPWAYSASFDPNLHRLRAPGKQPRDHLPARPRRLPQPASDPGGLRDRPALHGPLRQPDDAAGGPDHRGRRPDVRRRQDRPVVRQLVRHQACQPDRRRRPVPAVVATSTGTASTRSRGCSGTTTAPTTSSATSRPAAATSLDPNSCKSSGACWTATEIHYVNPGGQQLTASVEGPAQPSGAPSYSPTDPVEGSPVTFSANDFLPGGSTGHETYTWRFQHLGCGWIECVRNDQGVPAPPVVLRPGDRRDGDAHLREHRTRQGGADGHRRQWTHGPDGLRGERRQRPADGGHGPARMGRRRRRAGAGRRPTSPTPGRRDDENVVINYGDGTQASRKVGPNSINLCRPRPAGRAARSGRRPGT